MGSLRKYCTHHLRFAHQYRSQRGLSGSCLKLGISPPILADAEAKLRINETR